MAAKHISRLEARLNKVGSIDPHAEHQISILRMILQGAIGTPVQRAMLIRIVRQYSQPSNKSWYLKLAASLGVRMSDQVNMYLASYIKPPNKKKSLAAMAKRKKRKDKAKYRELTNPGTPVRPLTFGMMERAAEALRAGQNPHAFAVHDEALIDAIAPAPAATGTGTPVPTPW